MDAQNVQNEIKQSIITLFDIDKLPEEKQEEAIGRIARIILQSVLIRVLPLLPEKDLEEYEKLINDKAEADQVFNFFFEKVPGFAQILAEETENFRKESAEVLNNIK